MTSNWSKWAPLFVMSIVFILTYFIAYKSKETFKNKIPFSIRPSILVISWIVMFLLLAVSWVRSNLIVESVSTFQLSNWAFSINIFLILAWVTFFIGDGDFFIGLLLNILLILVAIWLIITLSFDPAIIILITIYLLMLTVALIFNIYMLKISKSLLRITK